MAIVIEYYMPEKFRKKSGKWIPPEQRGTIVPFPYRERSLLESSASISPSSEILPLALQHADGADVQGASPDLLGIDVIWAEIIDEYLWNLKPCFSSKFVRWIQS